MLPAVTVSAGTLAFPLSASAVMAVPFVTYLL